MLNVSKHRARAFKQRALAITVCFERRGIHVLHSWFTRWPFLNSRIFYAKGDTLYTLRIASFPDSTPQLFIAPWSGESESEATLENPLLVVRSTVHICTCDYVHVHQYLLLVQPQNLHATPQTPQSRNSGFVSGAQKRGRHYWVPDQCSQWVCIRRSKTWKALLGASPV